MFFLIYKRVKLELAYTEDNVVLLAVIGCQIQTTMQGVGYLPCSCWAKVSWILSK